MRTRSARLAEIVGLALGRDFIENVETRWDVLHNLTRVSDTRIPHGTIIGDGNLCLVRKFRIRVV